ncbi:AraC family transcriptional regulator [Pseudolactococcus yaeyamensis]
MTYWEKGNHNWTSDSLRYIKTPSQKTRDLFYYIQEVGHFKANQPYFAERSNLPSYLVKLTLSGEGELFYNETHYQIQVGDIFFIDCENYQRYATVSEVPWEMDWIHFNGAQATQFYEEFIKTGGNVFHTDKYTVLDNPIHLILTQLLNLQKQTNVKTDFQSSILIHELLNELLLQKFHLDFDEAEIPDYILQIKKHLDEHFKAKMTLEMLEQIFHINKYQIVKDFTRYIGTSPINYYLNHKISYAKDLLRYSDFSIKEIALEIGFDNYAYFSRLFRKKTGLAPKVYRKIG